MVFDGIIGNAHIKQYLNRALDKGVLGQSLLFAGLSGIGKSLFAEACAKKILGLSDLNHPDLHIYKPEGKIGLHSIDSMREFSEQVYLAPYQAPKKVFILHDADRMLSYSANALLKTFEEPSKESVIILLSSSPEALLSTILSRCRHVRFHPLKQEDICHFLKKQEGLSDEQALSLAALAEGSLGKALKLLKSPNQTLRQTLFDALSQGYFRNYQQLLALTKTLSEQMEGIKEEDRESLKAHYDKEIWANLSASQKDLIEKELDGVVATLTQSNFKTLCVDLLSWYRDLHLLSIHASPSYLINQDYQTFMQQALQRGELLPLDFVEKTIKETLLSFQRSTPLAHCLETLLLQLKRL